MNNVTAAPTALVVAPVEVDAARVKSVESIARRQNGLNLTTAQITAQIIGDAHADQIDPAAVTGMIHLWATGCACPAGRGKVCKCGARGEVKVEGKSTLYGQGVDMLTKSIKSAITDAIKGLSMFSPAPAPADEDAANEGSDEGDEGSADEDAPDYLALAVQAAATAVSNGVEIADVLAAIAAAHVLVLAS